MSRRMGDWFADYGGRTLGVALGLVLALLVLQYGLLRAIFILMVVAVGYTVGLRIDQAGGLTELFERLGRRD